MTTERTTEAQPKLQTVEFIDAWLDQNALWVDSRVMDFALDVRTLLSSDNPSEFEEREPITADA